MALSMRNLKISNTQIKITSFHKLNSKVPILTQYFHKGSTKHKIVQIAQLQPTFFVKHAGTTKRYEGLEYRKIWEPPKTLEDKTKEGKLMEDILEGLEDRWTVEKTGIPIDIYSGLDPFDKTPYNPNDKFEIIHPNATWDNWFYDYRKTNIPKDIDMDPNNPQSMAPDQDEYYSVPFMSISLGVALILISVFVASSWFLVDMTPYTWREPELPFANLGVEQGWGSYKIPEVALKESDVYDSLLQGKTIKNPKFIL